MNNRRIGEKRPAHIAGFMVTLIKVVRVCRDMATTFQRGTKRLMIQRSVICLLVILGVLAVTSPVFGETLLTTQTPVLTNIRDGVSVNYELGMSFTSVAAGQITAIRFWKGSSESGTHTGRIWSASGQLLTSVTFTGETASGWQQQSLATPLSIAANTTYVVSVNTGNAYYVATNNGLATQISSGNLRSVVGTNGRYGSTGQFPTNTWQSTNYFRDVVFVASGVSYSMTGTVSPVPAGSGVTISVTGPSSATTTTNSSGVYTVSGLANGTYTITPSKAAATFTQSSRTVTISGANVTGQDFTIQTYSISGIVTGGADATVSLTGAASATVTADAAGSYIFSGLLNGNYTVTPSKAGSTFSPANRAVTISGANATNINFAAVYSISGTVTGGGGATMTLSGAASATVTADASGNFSFGNLSNGDYTVTPSKAGVTFTPPSLPVTITDQSVSAVNFTAPTYSISGTVTGGGGSTLTLSGPVATTVTADPLGVYSISGLPSGQYTVTPSKSGFSFDPVSQPANISSANVTGIDFTATVSTTITIDVTAFGDRSSAASTVVTSPAFSTGSGNELLLAMIGADVSTSSGTNNTVTSVSGGGLTWVLVRRTNTQRGTAEIWRAFATAPLSNVTVTANLAISAVSSITVMSFRGVNTSGTNGSGAIGNTGSGSGSTGTPTASLVTLGSNSLVVGVGEDWNAAPLVTAGSNQTVIHQLALTNLATFWTQRQNATTPASGTTVTINDTAPTNHIYNLTICEILAGSGGTAPTTYTISGTITPTTGGANATVAMTGTATASTTTTAAGAYSFSGLANGNYTLTPSNAGYTFSPVNLPVTINGANVSSANFTATPQGQTFSISGTLTPTASGAVLALSGSASATTTADASGNYTFTGLGNGNYTVTPGKSGFTFNPTAQQVTINGANPPSVDFTASAASVVVTISPTSASLAPAGTGQFTATVAGSTNTAVTWSASGGTVSVSGLYTAASAIGTYSVTATSVADNTKSASATVLVATPTLSTLLLGDPNVETQADSSLPLGQAEAFQLTANASGSMQSLAVYLDTSSTVSTLVAGLYSDNGGHPGTLLNQGSTTQLVPGTWNTIIVPPTSVVAGTSYWIAILGTNTGTLTFRRGFGSGCASEASAENSLTSLSSTWTGGGASSNCPVSAFGDGAKVFFYDTFAGTTLSPHWRVISRHGEYSQSETECNIPQQVSVNNGLTITTAAQTWSCGDFHPDGTVWHAPASWPYITGDIQWGSLNFTFGTVEIRAKVPSSSTSLWPATWLLGSNCQLTNPYTGETGVGTCPNIGQSGYTEIDMTECYSGNWCQFHVANPSFFIGNGCDLNNYSDDTNFHVFKTVWEANRIRQYRDDVLVTTCNQAMSKPMFLIIQTQTGGTSGTPNNSFLPADFVVDYVKVTQP